MILTFVFSFFLSLLESSWLKMVTADIVKYEMEHKQTKTTALMKKILKNQPIVVSFILLMIYSVLYFGPLTIGRLAAKTDGPLLEISLFVYPLFMFYLGEIVPKIFGIKFSFQSCKYSAHILFVLMIVFYPITWLIKWTTKIMGGYEEVVDEKDVIALARLACEQKALSREEAAILERYLAVNNLHAKDLMVPIKDCSKVKSTTSRADLLGAVKRDRPILIVDDQNPKIVIGFISPDDLLEFVLRINKETLVLRGLVSATIEIPNNMLIGEAYALLKNNPVGRVIDKSEKTLGIITLHDIVVKFLQTQDDLE
jgi:CBS domain containing-hemolysin-like protein